MFLCRFEALRSRRPLFFRSRVVPVAAQGIASTVQMTVTTPLTIYYGQNVDGYANVSLERWQSVDRDDYVL